MIPIHWQSFDSDASCFPSVEELELVAAFSSPVQMGADQAMSLNNPLQIAPPLQIPPPVSEADPHFKTALAGYEPPETMDAAVSSALVNHTSKTNSAENPHHIVSEDWFQQRLNSTSTCDRSRKVLNKSSNPLRIRFPDYVAEHDSATDFHQTVTQGQHEVEFNSNLKLDTETKTAKERNNKLQIIQYSPARPDDKAIGKAPQGNENQSRDRKRDECLNSRSDDKAIGKPPQGSKNKSRDRKRDESLNSMLDSLSSNTVSNSRCQASFSAK